jgi:hypothetical protein
MTESERKDKEDKKIKSKIYMYRKRKEEQGKIRNEIG